MVIKTLSPPILYKEIELDSQSFLCDRCGVFIGTSFDFKFRDDHAIKYKKVEQSMIYCGLCSREMKEFRLYEQCKLLNISEENIKELIRMQLGSE